MMNKILVMTVVGTLAFTPLAFTPQAFGALGDPLYWEYFNNTEGDLPVSDFGWRQDYAGGQNSPNNVVDTSGGGFNAPTRLADETYGPYSEVEGMIFAATDDGSEDSNAWWVIGDTGYDDTANDSGPAFPSAGFSIASHPGLTFTSSIQLEDGGPTWPVYYLVQMNGTDWYRNTTAIADNGNPAFDNDDELGFSVRSQAFDPAMANWITMTISEDGSETSPTEGAAASSDLAGSITGVGWLVEPDGTEDQFLDSFFIHDETSNTPGDVNGDGEADEDDLAVIAANFGETPSTPGANSASVDFGVRSFGDLTYSGDVGFDDFFEWKDEFIANGGEESVVAAGLAAITGGSVPEPSSMVLAMMAMFGLVASRRTRRA